MVATQAQITAELNKRNYYQETVTNNNTIPPPDDQSFIEKYGTLTLLLFGGFLLISIFPGQGGQ